jgi:hypothetical protein
MFYDRLPFNNTIDESYRRQHPNFVIRFSEDGAPGTVQWDPSLFSRQALLDLIESGTPIAQEVFLIPNDLEPPYSIQWSGGLRHDFGSWNASATYTNIRSFNGFSFEWADVSFIPGRGRDCCAEARVIGLDGSRTYANVLVGFNDIRTWYDGVLLQVDRPYRRSTRNWGWGAGLAWTIAKAEAEGGDLFTFPQVRFNRRHPTGADERHRVVANWITDIPFGGLESFGVQFSGLITLGSGTPFNRTVGGNGVVGVGASTEFGAERPEKHNFIIPNAFAYRRVDLRLNMNLPSIGGNRVSLIADLFNAFNFNNFGCFDEFAGGIDDTGEFNPNPNFGRPGCVISDPRRLQLGLNYDFGRSAAGVGGR